MLADVGRICVFGARANDDLSPLGDTLQVVQGMKPDVDALAGRGIDVVTALVGEFGGALVVLARAKAETQDRVAQALAMTGRWPCLDRRPKDRRRRKHDSYSAQAGHHC